MKSFFFLCFSLFVFGISCQEQEVASNKSKKKNDEKKFLDHIKLNDSIEFRIKEYDLKNEIKRDLCVFKHDEVIQEYPIYFHRKKEILDEGYNTSYKKTYTSLDYDLYELQELTFHYNDYIIESVDTVITKIEVTPSGEISISK